MTHRDELPKPPKEAMTAATVRRLVDLYAIAYQRWHSEIGRALDLRALRDSETALSAAIEQLAAEQFEAGRQHERKHVAGECVWIAQST
ncbi:MAG: hypothetical protein RLZZ182_410 [Pseudomonadota bacterium]|jgi:hypothetical protein